MRPSGPGAAHPAYEREAPFVRRLMAEGRWHIRVPFTAGPRFAAVADPDPVAEMTLRTHILSVRKAVEPAPWTGCPFVYWWRVAVDELGREVAEDGPARIGRQCSPPATCVGHADADG